MGKVLDNKCPSCGSAITFNPTLGKFKCEYCNSEYTAEELENEKNKIDKDTESVDDKYVSYNCPDCGATIICDEETSATFCIYCGNSSIIKNRLTGKFSPSKIIPFKIEKEVAIKKFKNIRKGRPLTPKSFNSEKNIEKITGVYIPFWLFDVESKGNISGNATKSKSWTSGDTRYTKTDYYKVAREGNMNFYRVPVDGSTKFSDDIMNTIEPFNYDELIDFNHTYLSGFLAEKYNVEKEDAFNDAKKRSDSSAFDILKNDISGYSSKSIINKEIISNMSNCEYVLLPVYMVNVKYNDKFYLFAMNGQTGEFIGNIPLDKKKALLYGISLFIITFLLVILISFIIYKVGA